MEELVSWDWRSERLEHRLWALFRFVQPQSRGRRPTWIARMEGRRKRREFRLDHRETAEDEGRRGGLGQQVSAYGGRRSSCSSTSSIVSSVCTTLRCQRNRFMSSRMGKRWRMGVRPVEADVKFGQGGVAL